MSNHDIPCGYLIVIDWMMMKFIIFKELNNNNNYSNYNWSLLIKLLVVVKSVRVVTGSHNPTVDTTVQRVVRCLFDQSGHLGVKHTGQH